MIIFNFIGWVMATVSSWYCDHRSKTFVRAIYGDEINLRNGKRREWRCNKCGKTLFF